NSDDDGGETSISGSSTAGTQPAGAAVRGGELIVRRPSASTFADPHRSSSGYDPTLNHLYAAPLLKLSGGNLVPSLVSEWEQVDPTVVTLKLRNDLKFTDGTPVNAAAVKFAFERQADPNLGAPRRATLAGVTVDVIDDLTARVNFSKPNAPFLEALAINAPAGIGALVSPTAVEKLGNDKFNENPVSVGPFTIEKLGLDSESTFVPNPDWPITAPNGDKLPYLDRVRVRVIPETAVAVAELQSGGIDLDYVFLGENVAQIEGQSDLTVMVGKGAITQRVGLQLSKAPTNIVAFRKALAYAFDRDEFAVTFTDGLGDPGRGPLTQLTWAYDASAPYYSYDEKKARDFLSQAGLEGGTKVNICTYTSGVYPRIGEMIQAQLKKIGVDVTVDSMEVPVYTERYRKNGEYSLGLEGGGAPQGDPFQTLASLFGTANQPGGTEMPEVDALLEKALATFDREERKKVYGEIVKLDYDNVYKIWLIEAPTLAGINKAVQGVEWLPSGSCMDVTAAWKKA
ncbi:MAG: ABC transporter substrate-binding protein, partial [Hyphomicrobiales bacterium]